VSAAAGATLVHASCIAFDTRSGVLITGRSGRGKSALALALVDRGARLVCDDRTLVWRVGRALFARAPAPIAGLLEVRGLGLIRLPMVRLARLSLIIDADAPEPPRFPDPCRRELLGIDLPCLAMSRSPSFPAALQRYVVQPMVGAAR
jgi:HPr kinase/phosphorylase